MPQHDYEIVNQTTPSFRSDLNNALRAIVTQNSGSSAPTTTYADMLWYDTTNNQIKKRNEANSAWITLGTIDETAGTFTPTGQAAIATQAEAEAGTNNTKLMTPLRTSQAIAAADTEILGVLAGATAGGVGTYVFAVRSTGTGDVAFGSTLAGSSLTPTSAIYGWNSMSSAVGSFTVGAALSGTWRAMGYYDQSQTVASGATLWLRIS